MNRTVIGPEVDGHRITPYESWYKSTPSINHIRIWGCKCTVHIPKEKQQSKLHPRGVVGIFMGYNDKSNSQYRVYSITTRKVGIHDAACVVFDEASFGFSSTESSLDLHGQGLVGAFNGLPRIDSDDSQRAVTRSMVSGSVGVVGVSNTDRETLSTHASPNTEAREHLSGQTQEVLDVPSESSNDPTIDKSTIPNQHLSVIISTPPTNRDVPDHSQNGAVATSTDLVPMQIDSDLQVQVQSVLGKRSAPHDDHPDEQSQRKFSRVYCTAEDATDAVDKDILHGIDNPVPIPTSYDSAVNDPIYGAAWKEVTDIEIDQLAANDTFEIVEEPPNVNIVTCRWVWNV